MAESITPVVMAHPGAMFTAALRQLRRGTVDVAADLFPATQRLELADAADAGWAVDAPDVYCHRCGASAGPGSASPRGCPHCINQSVPWDQMVRLAAYREPIDRWIVALKFNGDWSWATWFGRQLAPAIRAARHNGSPAETGATAPTVVCPVPMHWLRRWRRGYNQAHLTAAALAGALNAPIAPLLRRTRYTPPQTAVPPSRRRDNVRDSFAIKPIDLTGWDVWLVDDVKTTGSTLWACTRLLRKAGARHIRIAVAAVADPKHADFTAV